MNYLMKIVKTNHLGEELAGAHCHCNEFGDKAAFIPGQSRVSLMDL